MSEEKLRAPRSIDEQWQEFSAIRLSRLPPRELAAAKFVFYCSARILLDEMFESEPARDTLENWSNELNSFGASIGETKRPMQ